MIFTATAAYGDDKEQSTACGDDDALFCKPACVQISTFLGECLHTGIDRSFISELENGKKEICIRNLEVIARAFDLTLSQLLSRL